jgi:methylmalonyl-CoA mutase N-terminal domain/subunit
MIACAENLQRGKILRPEAGWAQILCEAQVRTPTQVEDTGGLSDGCSSGHLKAPMSETWMSQQAQLTKVHES